MIFTNLFKRPTGFLLLYSPVCSVYHLKANIGLRRLEGELGEDWRILGDVSSLPRKTKRALKTRNEERYTPTFLVASPNENEGRFGTEGSVQYKEELLLTTRESVKSNLNCEDEVRTQWRKNSSSIAFLEKLLKDGRNEGKARTVTFGE